MKALSAWGKFRDPKIAKKVAAHIKELAPSYETKLCHICGTHEWTITMVFAPSSLRRWT
jgi:hydrogenase maturation factor